MLSDKWSAESPAKKRSPPFREHHWRPCISPHHLDGSTSQGDEDPANIYRSELSGQFYQKNHQRNSPEFLWIREVIWIFFW